MSRAYVPFYASFVADFVQVIGGDARFELCSGDIQYFSCQFANFAHRILPLGVQDVDFGPVQPLFALRYASLCPVRVSYGLGDAAPCRKWIDRSNRASERMCGKGIVSSSNWIGFRDNPWSNDLGDNTILCLALGRLVQGDVLAL